MGDALGVGRGIGHRLIGEDGGLKIDRNPGLELRQPGFGAYFVNAMRQERNFIRRIGMPVALQVADEPRESAEPVEPQPGRLHRLRRPDARGRRHVLHHAHGRHGKRQGLHGAGRSRRHYFDARLERLGRPDRATHEKGKTLWLYNTGMDRFSWGFYNWRARSEGRWEWHFCWPDDSARGGYPGREWYNPFTSVHGFAPLRAAGRLPRRDAVPVEIP